MGRYLVTGGTGFIGSNLALELERLGHEVVVADHFIADRAKNVEGLRGAIVEADVSRPFDVPGRFDAVFHQAALTDPRHHDDAEIFQRNVEGFRHVLAFARRHDCRVVYASTAGLYGNGPVPMREDQPKQCLTAYGRSKLEMDRIAVEETKDLPIVGLRYFNVFGPREAHKGRPASMILHLARQMREGRRPRIFEHGEQRRDHVYVKDAVRANLRALAASAGVYNVGTGVGTSFNDLVAILNEALGTRLAPEYFPMPYEPGTYQHDTVADVSLARERLGFTAEWSLRDAIDDYLRWLPR